MNHLNKEYSIWRLLLASGKKQFVLISKEKYTTDKIKASGDVWNIIRVIHFALPLFEQEKEYFYVLGLTRANHIKYIDVVSVGSATTTLCEAREVFRMAIHQGVSGGIILAHNHPSGNVEPSESDRRRTKILRSSGDILGIEVVDHIIFSNDNYYSFADSFGFE